EEGHEEGHDAPHAEPHEATWTMLVPLVALAGLAVVGGALNTPLNPFLEKWLDPVVGASANTAHISTTFKWVSAIATTVLCLGGIYLGFTTWARSARHEPLEPVVLKRAWFVDWAYAQVVEKPGLALSN